MGDRETFNEDAGRQCAPRPLHRALYAAGRGSSSAVLAVLEAAACATTLQAGTQTSDGREDEDEGGAQPRGPRFSSRSHSHSHSLTSRSRIPDVGTWQGAAKRLPSRAPSRPATVHLCPGAPVPRRLGVPRTSAQGASPSPFWCARPGCVCVSRAGPRCRCVRVRAGRDGGGRARDAISGRGASVRNCKTATPRRVHFGRVRGIRGVGWERRVRVRVTGRGWRAWREGDVVNGRSGACRRVSCVVCRRGYQCALNGVGYARGDLGSRAFELRASDFRGSHLCGSVILRFGKSEKEGDAARGCTYVRGCRWADCV